MKPETLILANILNEKIEDTKKLIKQLNEKDIKCIDFIERFTEDSISLSSTDEQDSKDIQTIVNSYIDILTKRLLKLEKDFKDLS